MRVLSSLIALLFMGGAAAAQSFDFPLTTGGRGQPRPAVVQTMTLSSSWKDGGVIPVKHTQPGHDVSPMLSWGNAPEDTQSFVLLMHDIDGIAASGATKFLYWMVWNIPKTAHELAEGIPDGGELKDGSRQISGSGPFYRGPAEPASGPAVHHYVFELYALNAALEVPALGQSPKLTEDAVRAAMTGKIVGKGSLVGTFKRN
jgi:Raf kinase inhibitor-like YbhB/YbcL family protein